MIDNVSSRKSLVNNNQLNIKIIAIKIVLFREYDASIHFDHNNNNSNK